MDVFLNRKNCALKGVQIEELKRSIAYHLLFFLFDFFFFLHKYFRFNNTLDSRRRHCGPVVRVLALRYGVPGF